MHLYARDYWLHVLSLRMAVVPQSCDFATGGMRSAPDNSETVTPAASPATSLPW